MDDFKLNAKKIIAAQKAKDRRAQSPETESNWDSSEPEDDDTVTQISSGEEFSVRSTHSQKSAKSSKTIKQAENLKNKTPSKPETGSSNRKTSKTVVESASAAKSAARSGVNVFVDRGMYDSEDDSQRSTTRKAKKRKDADGNPPYDFRNAINDDDPPSERSNHRPGRSRKGQSYDPAPPKPKPQAPPQIDTGSWDDSDENEKALAEMLRERDGVLQSNNNKASEDTETKPSEDSHVAEEKKKKKGWSVSLKSKTKETKEKKKKEKKEEKEIAKVEETKQEMPVAMVTPPHPALRHTEVEMEEFPVEEIKSIVSVETDNKARYVYIYHHGNTSYSDTRQVQEEVYMTAVADKSERAVRRCAQEIFATLRILVDLILIFLLEGLRFFLYNVIGALLVGLTLGFGNYFLRPFAAALFNGLCQPIAMFFFNVGVATRTATQPFIEVLHKMLSVVAMVIRAFRLVEINRTTDHRPHIQEV
ncbi:uncharacterized protein [Diadema antillarum]|uniref:uncharacterized protein n=1 Tax=Diadema antillarum TaxID=105358 RepID=UPI003A8B5366